MQTALDRLPLEFVDVPELSFGGHMVGQDCFCISGAVVLSVPLSEQDTTDCVYT